MKLAIFDFGGTLANTYPVFADSLNMLASKHRFRQVTPEELHRLRGLSATQILGQLELAPQCVPSVLSDFRKIVHRRIDEIRLFPGVDDALQTMAGSRIVLAIATSNSMDNVSAVLGHSILSRFSVVECASTLFGKAHRLHRILKRTVVDKAEAIYIGDEIRDGEAAEQAGLSFGAVGWGYTNLDVLLRLKPGKVFREPRDMISLI